jgi:predicted amidophosphoribosyltransferase
MTWHEALHRLIDPLDSVAAACTWVPPAGEGVCVTCHASAPTGRERCFSCFRTMAQVSAPVPAVVPISLYRTGDDLWHALRHYKDGRNATERRRLRRDLARLLSRFLRHHLACVAPGAPATWLITCVPPTRRRSFLPFQPRPVESLIRRSWWLRRRYRRTLSNRDAPEHRQSSDAAFAVTREVRGLELILVDDTYTTGASVQSAASALQLAGATVLAVVVIGRVVNPEANPAEARLWAAARRQPFRLQECCRDARLAPDLAAFPLPWSP